MSERTDPASGPAGVVSRRSFLKLGIMAAGPLLIPGSAMAGLWVAAKSERSLSFYNLHTGESLRTVYFEDGGYVKGALDEINYILRDFRRNEIKPIDPRLLDLLTALRQRLDTNACFDVISGYRSPKTNATLHARSEGVAVHSLHLDGKAIDICVPGRDLKMVRRAAMSLQGGGVGYYPASDFVHVDTGRVRHW